MRWSLRHVVLVGATALLVGMVLGVAIGRSRSPFGVTGALSIQGPQPELTRQAEGTPVITVAELARLIESGVSVEIVDVREPEEFATLHIPNARSIPLGAIWVRQDALPRDKAIVVYCTSDLRGEIAARELAKLGLKNVRYLDGGLSAWQNAGFAVAR